MEGSAEDLAKESGDGKELFLITAQPELGGDKLAAIECWNITGDITQQVRVFRNSLVAPGTLTFIGDNYVAGAVSRKPWISVWPLNQPIPVSPPLLTPSAVAALAVSPDGELLIAAFGNKLHVWQLSTGDFLFLLARHYQSINLVVFSNSGRYFASAGQDGIVFVWKTADVMCVSESHVPCPLSVSCRGRVEGMIFAGADVSFPYLVCVDVDHSCRVYDASTADQGALGTFVFHRSLLAVTADSTGANLAVADDAGDIFRLPLITQDSRSSQQEMMSEADWNQRYRFSGHMNAVRCLQFNGDGSILISGSADATVRIWQVKSCVCVRVLQFKGSVSNLLRCKNPDVLFSRRNLASSRPLVPLKKQLVTADAENGCKYSHIQLAPMLFAKGKSWTDSSNAQTDKIGEDVERQEQLAELETAKEQLLEQLKEKQYQLDSLRGVNQELYEFARENMLKLHKL